MQAKPLARGLLVNEVPPDSAADEAGIRANDIVLKVANQHVGSVAKFRQFVDRESSTGLELNLLRSGNEHRVRLRPDPRPREDIVGQIDRSAIGVVRIWDLETGLEIGDLPVPLEGDALGLLVDAREGMHRAAVSPDGKSIVTASRFGTRTELRSFNVASGRPSAPSVEYPRSVRWIGFGPLGHRLVTLDSTSAVQL